MRLFKTAAALLLTAALCTGLGSCAVFRAMTGIYTGPAQSSAASPASKPRFNTSSAFVRDAAHDALALKCAEQVLKTAEPQFAFVEESNIADADAYGRYMVGFVYKIHDSGGTTQYRGYVIVRLAGGNTYTYKRDGAFHRASNNNLYYMKPDNGWGEKPPDKPGPDYQTGTLA